MRINKQKNGFYITWCIFILPEILLWALAVYLKIIELDFFNNFLLSIPFWVIYILKQLIFLLVWKLKIGIFHNWNKDNSNIPSIKLMKSIVVFPKLFLYLAVIISLSFPFLVFSFYPGLIIADQISIALLSFSCTILFGLPFYIIFIRKFEHWSSNIPFDENHMSMKIATRTNLVVFLSMLSIFILTWLSIIYYLKNADNLEIIENGLVNHFLPPLITGLVMTLFNIILLMKGISTRIINNHKFATALAEGNFKKADERWTSRDELGGLYFEQFRVFCNTADLLQKLNASVKKTILSKDIILDVSSKSQSSITEMIKSINNVYSRMKELNENLDKTSLITTSLNNNLQKMNTGVMEQVEQVSSSTGAIGQMISSIDNISNLAIDKTRVAESLVSVSQEGQEKIDITVDKISKINENLEKITSIVSVIQGISARTNLLAMNAAIEAAHAGNAGKGFAVVSDEIRKLAESSSQSSKEIQNNIKDIITITNETSEAGGDAISSFKKIGIEVDEMIDSFRGISSGLSNLKSDSDLILSSVTSMKKGSDKVQGNTTELVNLTQNVDKAMKTVANISKETILSAKDMQKNSDEVNEINLKLKDQCNVLNDASNEINNGLNLFKF
jgi:methyl-accepting chemotaxis protein